MKRLIRTLLLAATAASIIVPGASAKVYTDAELTAIYDNDVAAALASGLIPAGWEVHPTEDVRSAGSTAPDTRTTSWSSPR